MVYRFLVHVLLHVLHLLLVLLFHVGRLWPQRPSVELELERAVGYDDAHGRRQVLASKPLGHKMLTEFSLQLVFPLAATLEATKLSCRLSKALLHMCAVP